MVVPEALDGLQEQATRSDGWSSSCGTGQRKRRRRAGGPPGRTPCPSSSVRSYASTAPDISWSSTAKWRSGASRIDGSRTDVHVQASAPGRRQRAAHRRHRAQGLLEPRASDRRRGPAPPLPAVRLAEIFLVGFFHSPRHERLKYKGFPEEGARPGKQGRHRTSKKHTPRQVLSDLQQQADSAPETLIYARVLQLPLTLLSASGATLNHVIA